MQTCVYNSPVGKLKLQATKDGLCAVKWLQEKQPPSHPSKQESTAEECLGDDSDDGAMTHIRVCIKWLDDYFDGSLLTNHTPRPNLALPMKGTFFHTVWETLSSTSVGETLSYKELAKLSGNAKAARAVGQAVRKHCLPILVPCHRVVRSGRRGVENYSGGEGTATKLWLLEHEEKMLKKSQV